MSLRHRIERLERKLGSATEDPQTSDMWKELRAEERRRHALRVVYQNSAADLGEKAGDPERAAAIRAGRAEPDIEGAFKVLGSRLRLAYRVAAAELLEEERARQQAEADRDQPQASPH